jgi:hypothetical protein
MGLCHFWPSPLDKPLEEKGGESRFFIDFSLSLCVQCQRLNFGYVVVNGKGYAWEKLQT